MSIGTIQGLGHVSPLVGEVATASGIVTALRSNGFYFQDPVGDGNEGTSDGLFVFTFDAPTVSIGDEVEVTGTVSEFQPGGSSTNNLTITQLGFADVNVLSSGNDLPSATVLGDGGRPVPNEQIDDDGLTSFDPEEDAIDYYESVEGMIVEIENAVAVGATSRFGEIPVLADGGENNDQRTEAGGVYVAEDAFNPDRIHLDDSLLDTPNVNVGDQFDGTVTGVVDYSFGNYKIQLIDEAPSVIATDNSPEVTKLTSGDDQLTVATYNVLNLDPSDGSIRGSDDQYTRLANQIVDNLQSPDIIALQEIQDNNGTTDDGTVAASETLQKLVDAIAFEGGPAYEISQIDPIDNQDGGAPGSNIRVAYLYNPERVSLPERGEADATTEVTIADGPSFDPNPARVDPNNPIFSGDGEGTRKSLAAEFEFNGESIFLINNHLSSKFGSLPLFGDTQPADDSTAEQRDAQAEVIRDFVEEILAADPNAKVVVLGDLNEFEFRNTHNIIEEAGLTNLIDLVQVEDRYTFNFEGNSQILDGLLVSPSLSNSTEIDIVHVNTDFNAAEIAASDHEPVVARIDFSIPEYPLVGRYAAGGDEPLDAGAEIVAHDASTQRLFITNSADGAIDIVDINDPSLPTKIGSIDISLYGDGVNSVAVKNGVVAAAIENPNGNLAGSVIFFDADGHLIGTAEAGVLPDNITFTPDGSKLLVANEGEPTDEGDPRGGVTIIDMTSDTFVKPTIQLDFGFWDDKADALEARGVRLFEGRPPSEDLEPEYIAVSPDGTEALVTLQENNAVARVNLETNKIVDIRGLGTKDHSLEGNGLDASDRDGGINIQTHPVHGLYMPDAIGSFESDGKTFYVIANEGDDRGEDERIGDLDLDPTAFPNAEELQQDENLGRLGVSTVDGDTDGDGDFDQLFSYGARSFSVLDAKGNIVFDSGDQLEQLVAQHMPAFHNSQGDPDSFDGRSDNKGPEPEGIVTFTTNDGIPMVAVGLERAGGVMLFDLSTPTAPEFRGYFVNRDADADPDTLAYGDISPEGLAHISAADSPTGEPLLVVAHEVTGTVSLFKLEEAPEPFTLQLLAASDLEGGVNAITNAPQFAQLIEHFQGLDIPTLTVSAGDNVIPGPFFTSASEDGVSAALTDVYRELLGDETIEIEGAPGRLDMSIMNILGFDASAIGNHEFDAGEGGFDGYVRPDGDYPGPLFPYLSGNLDFSESFVNDLVTDEVLSTESFMMTGEDGSEIKIAEAAIATKGGEKIGIVGGTTQILETITSTGDISVEGPTSNDMPALAELLQPIIDGLETQGVNKIILTTHLQNSALELELVELLSGVDIVLAGGSDPLFADENDVLRDGDVPDFDGPVVTQNADGDTAIVFGAPGEYSYLGRLVVDFDAGGRIIEDSLDIVENGSYAAIPEVVDAVTGGADPGERALLVDQLTDAVADVVVARDSNTFGETEVFLDGRRGSVRTEETNMGNLTADANLAIARETDPDVVASLKNGGGIRAEIGTFAQDGTPIPPEANPLAGKEEGEISQLDIENTLRFNNGLSIIELTRADLVTIVEHGVAATEDGATPGQFGQVSGLAFSFDSDQPAGDRIQTLALLNDDGSVKDLIVEDGEIQGDGGTAIKIVTLSFLADGGDSYPYPDVTISRTDLFQPDDAPRTGIADFAPDGTEQDALAEYLEAAFGEEAYDLAETDPVDDERIQDLGERADTVADGLSVPIFDIDSVVIDTPVS